MKNSHIATLEKVAEVLTVYLPIKEMPIYKEYMSVCSELRAKNDKEKQNYRDNAEYYRKATEQWKKDNPEKHRAHQTKSYLKCKRKKIEAELESLKNANTVEELEAHFRRFGYGDKAENAAVKAFNEKQKAKRK